MIGAEGRTMEVNIYQARGELHCVGATIDEYRQYMKKTQHSSVAFNRIIFGTQCSRHDRILRGLKEAL